MKILFWSVVAAVLTTAPVVLRIDGDFCLNKKTFFVAVRLFRTRVFSLIFYFAPDGIYYSILGKKGKKIKVKSDAPKKKVNIPFSIEALRFTHISVKIYIGGDAERVHYGCFSASMILGTLLKELEGRKLLDRGEVLVLPSYAADQMTVNFSICLFTSALQYLASLVHTKGGDNYAKRRYREYNGENAG